MSMLLSCDTMSMKNILSVTLKFFNGETQLQATTRPIIILKKNECLLCSTCIAIWKRWIRISCKGMLYFLPP
jgi:formate hydrogenlyase subunit 6/NADH:ubiquinone oxidoreductase subunit I